MHGTLQPWRPQYKTIISWVPVGANVLDIGCGDGVLGDTLIREKNCRVWGFDLDPIGVNEANRKGIHAVVHDASKQFPYKNRQFDVAICNEVLEFVEDPNRTVSEALRVAKAVIIEFPNFGFWFYRLEMLFGRFPQLALYGHRWWDTRQIKFFSYNDFSALPIMKKVRIEHMAGIDWKNRRVSWLASRFPNIFARSVIAKLQRNTHP